LASASADPAKDCSIFVPVRIHAEVSCTLVDGALILNVNGVQNRPTDLRDAPAFRVE
jgi:hypothetical protein